MNVIHVNNKGSRWTFQAARMDGTLGSITILPDQFQIANPLLILALVPTFDSVIYPLSTKCGLVLTPLKRMSIGGLFAALAFVVSGAVELLIEVFTSIVNIKSTKKYNIGGCIEPSRPMHKYLA